MRELREDTFSRNKDEDAHDHIDRVLSIVGLFNIPGVSKDVVMLRVFPFTFTGSAKRWVDGLAPGTINTWDLLKKAFIQRYCPPSMTVKQLKDIHNFKQEGDESLGLGAFRVGPPGYYTKIDNRPPYSEKRQGLEELLAKHQEEYARRSTKIELWIKKLQENAEVNTRNQRASLQNLETQIEQLTKEIHSDKTLSSSLEQIKIVTTDHETSGLNKLHGVSFISGLESDTPEVLQHQLPSKELNPGSFTLPYTIGKFNFYAMADLGASINVEDSVWSKKYSEWCNENPHGKLRPRYYTFKEWVKLKKGHLDISKSVRKDLFRLWAINRFTKASDPDKNPLERCFDEYKWVFHTKIQQRADEHEIKIREKGQVLEEIWTKCKRARCKNKNWWYDYWYEDEEKTELGNKDYDPPKVHTETFEIKKYRFDNGCSFICVSDENNETLSLGRKNGSRFRKMIMEEMEKVLRDDKEDDNKT
ncbi:DNA-binding pseudobarrel domain-containing protein [Tanacetum coccineum]